MDLVLENVTSKIDPIFLSDDFNAKRYILRQVVGRFEDEVRGKLDELNETKQEIDHVIQFVVNRNYETFGTSLREFSEIYKTFNGTLCVLSQAHGAATQEAIVEMVDNVNESRHLLSKSTNLTHIFKSKCEAESVCLTSSPVITT